MNLNGKQRRFLRAEGHALKPKVWVGKQGVIPTLVGQVDTSLANHELIKVKLLESCPLAVAECADALAVATHAAVAQTIGRTILLYRPHPERPVLQLPKADGIAIPVREGRSGPEAVSAGEP